MVLFENVICTLDVSLPLVLLSNSHFNDNSCVCRLYLKYCFPLLNLAGFLQNRGNSHIIESFIEAVSAGPLRCNVEGKGNKYFWLPVTVTLSFRL